MKKLLLIVSLLLTMNASAIPLTALLNGGSIIVGDKLFDDWEIIHEFSSDFDFFGVDTDKIEVTGLPGGLDPGPGLHFEIMDDELSIEGDGIFAFLDFMFGFRVSVLDPLLKIKDNSLYLTDYELINTTTSTTVYIGEEIYGDANYDTWLGDKFVEANDGIFNQNIKLFDAADFAPTDEIWVTKNIYLEAWDFGEIATLRSFEQRFSQIPEPSILLLFSLGLFALVIKKKRA